MLDETKTVGAGAAGAPATASLPDRDALDAEIARNAAKPRGRGRPRKDGTIPAGAGQPTADPSVFSGENWESLGAVYFDVRRAVTGHEVFSLTEKQRRVLGVSVAKIVEAYAPEDPRIIILAMGLANIAAVVLEKEIAYHLIIKAEQAAAREHE